MVPSTPRPVRVVAIFPDAPDIEAVGVPLLTFMNANLLEAVDTPPRRRSSVDASFGCIVPDRTFQSSPAAPPQSVQVGEEAPEIRLRFEAVVDAAATIPDVSVP